jgi:xanthine dehydrogenase accessory factor
MSERRSMGGYLVSRLSESLYSLGEDMGPTGFPLSVYLLVGSERAALIDSGLGTGNLAAAVRGITDRPVLVLHTHGHLDHVGGDPQFEELYIDPGERAASGRGYDWADPAKASLIYRPLRAGQVFDLGSLRLESYPTQGHTPGSFSFVCDEERVAFTGDGIADIHWFDSQSDATVEGFLTMLRGFSARTSGVERYFAAHLPEAFGRELLDDLISAAAAVAAGSEDPIEIADYGMLKHGPLRARRSGAATIYYAPERVRAEGGAFGRSPAIEGRAEGDSAPFRELVEALDAGRAAALCSAYGPGGTRPRRRCLSEPISAEDAAAAPAAKALESGRPMASRAEDGSILALIEPFFPRPVLLVLGGGHIGAALARFAPGLGFETTVCDDRPSFAAPDRFPSGVRAACSYFVPFIDAFAIGPSTYVVIATRGHRHDLECWRALARRGAAYIGMVGSRGRIAGLRRELEGEGLDPEFLAGIKAPIGLDIGASGPIEIALSIAAELVACRRKGPRAADSNSETEMDVLRELAKESAEPRALITVLAARGSTPRRPGAKMIAWRDGRTLGTIGGGCAEGAALVAARDRIREGDGSILEVELSGSVVEDEGMACGGAMTILVEAL